jgi:hypothetical protein
METRSGYASRAFREFVAGTKKSEAVFAASLAIPVTDVSKS